MTTRPRSSAGFDALVLDARLRQSLAAIRSIGRRGHSVAAIEAAGKPPAFWSRWCHRALLCGAAHGSDAYAAFLHQWVEQHRPRVVFASHDGTISALRRHRAALEGQTRLALADEPALGIASDKRRTLAIAGLVGVRVPPTIYVESAADTADALAEIGLPAVLKPSESWQSNGRESTWIGAHLVTTTEEARQAIGAVARYGGTALLQPFLTGRREAVSVLYARGEVHARFAQWASRMNPPLGGESVLRQSIAVPADTGDAAERLVRAIDLEGYSEIEFRRDAAGVPYLMEINPRLSASVEIAVRSGVDFPHLIYQWATGERIDSVRAYRTGRWMRYLQGDVTTTIEAIHQRGRPGVPAPFRAARDFAASFFRPMRYDYVDWADPLPAIKAFGEFAGELARRSSKAATKPLMPGAAAPARGPSET